MGQDFLDIQKHELESGLTKDNTVLSLGLTLAFVDIQIQAKKGWYIQSLYAVISNKYVTFQ